MIREEISNSSRNVHDDTMSKRSIDDVAAEPAESDDDSDDESESEAEDTGPPRCSCGALSKYRCPGCGEPELLGCAA